MVNGGGEEEEGRRISHSSDRLNEALHGAALLPRIPRCETGTRERERERWRKGEMFSQTTTPSYSSPCSTPSLLSTATTTTVTSAAAAASAAASETGSVGLNEGDARGSGESVWTERRGRRNSISRSLLRQLAARSLALAPLADNANFALRMTRRPRRRGPTKNLIVCRDGRGRCLSHLLGDGR